MPQKLEAILSDSPGKNSIFSGVAERPPPSHNEGMTWEIALVLAVLAVLFAGLVREWMAPEILAFSAACLLLLTGILKTEAVLSVFANEAAITVACMFVLAAGLERTGAIEMVGRSISAWAAGSEARFYAGLIASAAVISAFINNTPVVVVFMPIVLGVCRQQGQPPSRYLIPLSYATMLGGCCTLIGTSTNILASGLSRELLDRPLRMFDLAPIGIPLTLAGLAYLLAVRRRMPVRETLLSISDQIKAREYLTEAVIVHGSPLIGKRLRETPLASLVNVKIIELTRRGERLLEPIDSIAFEEGDRILVKTVVSTVSQIQSMPGIEIVPNVDLHLQPLRTAPAVLVEGVISQRSALIGQTIRLVNFRQKYDVLILAVHRQGENLRRKFEDVELRFGDVLLMEGTEQAMARLMQDPDFLMLTDATRERRRAAKLPFAVGIVAGVVLLASLDILPMSALAIFGALGMLLTGCLTQREAYRSIAWDTVLLIFGMLVVGKAMAETGAAAWLAGGMVRCLAGLPPEVVLSGFYLLVNVLTAILSNNAVAIIMIPIAVQTARGLGVDPFPFVIATAVAASYDFSTPIGYQTNTFVFSAGGYRFSDFVRMGVPLNLITWAAATVLIPAVYPLR